MNGQITTNENWVGDLCFKNGIPTSYLDNPLPYWKDYLEPEDDPQDILLQDRWDLIEDAVMSLLVKISPDDLEITGCDCDTAEDYVAECKQMGTCLDLIVAINDLPNQLDVRYRIWEKLPYLKEVERMRHGH